MAGVHVTPNKTTSVRGKRRLFVLLISVELLTITLCLVELLTVTLCLVELLTITLWTLFFIFHNGLSTIILLQKTTNFPPSTSYREMKKKKTIRTKVTLTNSLKRKAITTINILRQIIKSSGYKFYHFSCIGAIVQEMESTIWMTFLLVIKDLLRQVKQRNRFWIDE